MRKTNSLKVMALLILLLCFFFVIFSETVCLNQIINSTLLMQNFVRNIFVQLHFPARLIVSELSEKIPSDMPETPRSHIRYLGYLIRVVEPFVIDSPQDTQKCNSSKKLR